ncbi:tetratricopeptide repeat protein [Undibacterium sp. TC9W]|uniref:tetratricopeptide repeat protein n=1 Tax=Undibacterium sp. TC9W TaxID=3413053 RepID=UPI003BF314D4
MSGQPETASPTPNQTATPSTHSNNVAALAKDEGDKLLRSGNFAHAEQCYQAAIASNPQFGDAYINLSIALRLQSRFDDAVDSLEQARQISPADVYVLYNLGVTRREQGMKDLAIALFQKVLELDAAQLDASYDLSNIYLTLGDATAARDVAAKALMHHPQEAALHIFVGNIDRQNGNDALALSAYEKAAAINPKLAEAQGNIAMILQRQGNYKMAETRYKKLIELEPDRYEAHFNLGIVLLALGRFDEAVASYLQALAIKPDAGEIYHNLGNAYRNAARPDEAEASFRKATTMKSGAQGWAYSGLGDVLRDKGYMEQALDAYRTAFATDADYLDAHCSLLFNLGFGTYCSPDEYRAEINFYRDKLAARRKPYTSWLPRPAASRSRLRVGLVSGDLRVHPVGYFLENVIPHLSQQTIELFAYASSAHQDTLTDKLKPYFSQWRSIVGMDDQVAAAMIHADALDVLLDLSGHTADNRLPLFACKPAPIQASWLGYFGSTGVPGMDYVLADRISVPENTTEYFTEKICHLPRTRLCFAPPVGGHVQVSPLPARNKGHLTFGSFQSAGKFNDFTIALWADVLKRLPQAKLRLQNRQLQSASFRQHLLKRFAELGITEQQLELHGPSSREAYLAAHAEVDMILDSFPYSGGTTTCEALWMGVPTLSLAGQTMASRQGLSLLTYAGLPDWIAKDSDEFVDLAVAYASKLDELAALRSNLRDQVAASSLFDGPLFARGLESALLQLQSAHHDKR